MTDVAPPGKAPSAWLVMALSLAAALAQVPLLLVGLSELGGSGTWIATLILHEPLWFMVILAGLVGVSSALAIKGARGAKRRRQLLLACGFALAVIALFHLDAAILRWTATVGSWRRAWRLTMGPTGYHQAAFIGLSTLALVSRIHAEAIEIDAGSQSRSQAWRRLAALVTVSALVHVPFYWWGMERALRSSLVHWELPGVGHLVALVSFDLMARATRGRGGRQRALTSPRRPPPHG